MSAFEVSRLGFRAVEPSASVATPRLALARRSFRVWRGEFSAARGDAFSAGDIDHAFSIQSVSKPFVAVLARGKALRSGSGDSWVDIQAGAVSLAFGLTAVRDGTPVPAAVPPGTDHSWREKRRTRSSKKQSAGSQRSRYARPGIPTHRFSSGSHRWRPFLKGHLHAAGISIADKPSSLKLYQDRGQAGNREAKKARVLGFDLLQSSG